MKTILFLTPRLPYPPDRGDKVRSHQFLKLLSTRYHVIPVSLYSNSDRKYVQEFSRMFPQAQVFYQSPLRMAFNLIKGIFDPRPLQVIIYRNPYMQKKLAQLAREGNPVIYAFFIRMLEYLEPLDKNYRIADLSDCISMEYERRLSYLKGLHRFVYALEASRLRRMEKAVNAYANESWFISAIDRSKLGLPSSTCHIIPNATQICPLQKDYRFYGRIIFVGRMSVPHNIQPVEYIREFLLDEILKHYPKLSFDIIGAGPTRKIQAMNGTRNTHVHGFVPDLYKALTESDVFVAPMFFSAGMQNKILEAMAAGVPVLMTENVAESIGCEDRIHYLKASNQQEFLAQILELLGSEELRRKIGTAGRLFIEQHYSPRIVSEQIYARIEAAFQA